MLDGRGRLRAQRCGNRVDVRAEVVWQGQESVLSREQTATLGRESELQLGKGLGAAEAPAVPPNRHRLKQWKTLPVVCIINSALLITRHD